MKHVVVIALCFALFVVPVARADDVGATATPAPFANQRPVAPRLVDELETIAGPYWSGREVALPPLVAVYAVADADLGFAAGRAEVGGGQVWLAQSGLAAIRDTRPGHRAAARLTLCETYLHERGHNAGLTHEAGWIIMAPTTGLGAAPRCETWADWAFRRGASATAR